MIRKPVETLEIDDWNRVIGTNLTGAFLCAKHCAAHLRKSRGSIVNMCSTRGFMSEPDTESYSASKGGIFALTHSLAISLGPDIRVNCVSPGWIDVSSWQDHLQHPVGRVGKPEDIASIVMYLSFRNAEFITGQNFTVDGGVTRKMIYLE